MSRTISIHSENADEAIKSLECLIKSYGAIYIPNVPENRSNKKKYETSKGAIDLEKIKLEGIYIMEINIRGDEELWGLGSDLTRKIIEYSSEHKHRLLRNQITNKDGNLYIKGASVSDHEAEENKAKLIDESFQTNKQYPPHWFRLNQNKI